MYKAALLFAAGTALGITLAPHVNQGAAQAQGKQSVGDFPDLGRGLMETPGCVGIQGFTVNGGKTQVISAWFENRKAMENWYYGEMHQDAMAKFFPDFKSDHKPFAAFKDEKSPMLVIASVTPGGKAVGNGSQLAVSQIAIEGYTPIPGGIALGGSFAPAKLKVPGLQRIPVGN